MKKLLRSLASVVAALAILLGLEFALRGLGIGDSIPGQESSLVYQRVFLPALEPAADSSGRKVLRTTDTRHGYQALAAESSQQSLRVVVFGGSATAGLGSSPNTTFASYLERLLTEAYPQRKVEVLNLGVVALPSTGVVHLLEDACRSAAPDLAVVYSGNNEFLELHSQRFFEATASAGDRAKVWLGRTNLLRALQKGKAQKKQRLDTRSLAAGDAQIDHRSMMREVKLSAQDRLDMEQRYEDNLMRMAAVAKEHEVPLVLMTVAANWRWWGMQDFEADEDPGEGEHRRHHELYAQALTAESAGDLESAGKAFREAMNVDPHLRRATDDLAEKVRKVAFETEAIFFDSTQALIENTDAGIVGFESFYDYVHFTPEGASWLAFSLLRALQAANLQTGNLLPKAALDNGQLSALRDELLEPIHCATDSVDVQSFAGFGLDPSYLQSRDLWKYDGLRDELQSEALKDSNSAQGALAHAYLGNMAYFELNGAEEAREHWQVALQYFEGLPGGSDANAIKTLESLRNNLQLLALR